jgi:hypothetical protein
LMEQLSSRCWIRLYLRPLKNMYSISSSNRCPRSCKQYRAYVLFGKLTLLINWNVAYMQSGDKVCGDMRWLLQTGRIPWKCTTTRRSSSCSSQLLAWHGLNHIVQTTCHYWWSKPLLPDLTILTQYNHEKADSRMLLHVFSTVQYGHHALLIRTVDTDAVVLSADLVQELRPTDKLWLAFGTGQSCRYLVAHEVAAGLVQESDRALPIAHAQTWCYTFSMFHTWWLCFMRGGCCHLHHMIY